PMRTAIGITLIGALTLTGPALAQPWRQPLRMSGPEATAIADYWIQSYLRRSPTADEIRYWADQLERYPAINGLRALLSSQEYYDLAGGPPPSYIARLLEDVGHRSATRFEVQDWLRRTRGMPPRDIALLFLREFPANWWPGPEATPPPELERFYGRPGWHW